MPISSLSQSKSSLSVIYISHVFQNQRDNWTIHVAKSLQLFSRVIHFSVFDKRLSIKDCFVQKKITDIFYQIYFAFCKNYTAWTFFNLIPFERYQIISQLNDSLNYIFFNFCFKRNSKLILIICDPLLSSYQYLHNIKADLRVADCFDFNRGIPKKLMRSHFDICFTNAQPLYRYYSRYMKKVYLVPTGYFLKSLILTLSHKKYRSKHKKTVLFIGNISMRINYPLLSFLLNKMPDYEFVFAGPLMYTHEVQVGKKKKLAEQFKKDWKKLSSMPNFKYVPLINQEGLPTTDIKASIGIIPTDPKDEFNKYCHPIKLYLYLAMKLPVVSTPIPSIEQMKYSFISFAHSFESFAQEIERACTQSLTPSQENKMISLALEQTAENKAKKINEILTEEIKGIQ